MIQGRVTARSEILIPVEIVSSKQQPHSIEVLLDTGFNGYLTLPGALIRKLNLPLDGNHMAELGDGTLTTFDVYLTSITWHGRVNDILVLRAEGEPLLGMALLRQNRLIVDVLPGGQVEIHPIGNGVMRVI